MRFYLRARIGARNYFIEHQKCSYKPAHHRIYNEHNRKHNFLNFFLVRFRLCLLRRGQKVVLLTVPLAQPI